MTGVEPLELDRSLRRAARHWVQFRRSLRRGEALDWDPFVLSGKLTSAATFRATSQLSEPDPLRTPLRRWLWRLLEQRVNRKILVWLARQRHEVRPVDAPRQDRLSVAQIEKQYLADAGLRGAWLKAYFKHSSGHTGIVSGLEQRRQELLARLDARELIGQCSPCADVDARATRLLEETQDAYDSLSITTAEAYLHVALAESALEGWPAKVSPRSIRELIGRDGLLEQLELDPGPLPATFAPASFGRALMRVGAAIVDASAPAEQPFCVAHDAFGLMRCQFGALLGGLLASPPFLKRRLDLSPAVTTDHARTLAQAWLLEGRAAALRVLLLRGAEHGETSLLEQFGELSQRCLGFELPRAAAGTWFKLHDGCSQRFVGYCLASAQRRHLTDVHDEDWFRNPKAIEQLRDEASSPPRIRVSDVEIDSALAETILFFKLALR